MSSKIKVKYPISMQWKIQESRLQEIRNTANAELTSVAFDIPGTDVKYFMSISPNGLLFEKNEEIEAQFSISIDSANLCECETYAYKKFEGYGFEFCNTDDLFDPEQKFIVDGELDIKLKGILKIEKDAKLCQLGGSGNQLCVDLWNQDNKDFTIIVDGKEIQVHKLILSTRSPVFAAMFKPHTKESQENRVTIPDFSFDVVEAAIKFCYHHSLVDEIQLDNKISLLQFDKYDIQCLKEDLEKHLISEIDETNVCLLANCSLISNSPKLQSKCSEFLQKCLQTRKPVIDLNILDKDFLLNLVENRLSNISL